MAVVGGAVDRIGRYTTGAGSELGLWRMVGAMPTIVSQGSFAAGVSLASWMRRPTATPSGRCMRANRSFTIAVSFPGRPSSQEKSRPSTTRTPTASKYRGAIATIDTQGSGWLGSGGRPSISTRRGAEPLKGKALASDTVAPLVLNCEIILSQNRTRSSGQAYRSGGRLREAVIRFDVSMTRYVRCAS